MPLSTRLPTLLAALALSVVAVAGCGGSDEPEAAEVPADAIAVVGDRAIPKTEYDRLLAQAQATYEAREQDFPAAGTPEFAQLRNSIVRSLVEQTQFEIAAEERDLTVTDDELQKRLDELEKQGLTEEQVLKDLRLRMLAEKLFEDVTKDVQVTDADVEAYYEQNKTQFEQPASREVRHILVKTKAKADQLHAQLENGADFAKLAKQFSTDTASAKDGGKFTAQKGATVAPFDKVAFELETGELSEPVKTQFGWHLIEAVGDIQDAATQPLDDVSDQIKSTLLDEKKNTRINEWTEELKARFADLIVYAPGFEPPPEADTTTGADTTQTETDSK